ncbi:MAG TPA: heme o synthase [Blastocatellia bacterium]|nr:heme o synthase [Blastocatellia bacterium]
MMPDTNRIERYSVTDERNDHSGLVRLDGQRLGTQTNRLDAARLPLPARLMDFVSLTKPEVLLLVLIVTGAGCLLASPSIDVRILFNALLGTALVAGGTAALNHYAERAYDGKMRRTANRPLPAGRLTPQAVLRFGIVLSVAGTIYLAVSCNLLTGIVGLAALLAYLLIYTPLKRRTDLCTLVGAFPGAAPILMGWTAVRGDLTPGAWILYAILFFWQFPHFLAIGWMYRDDYARARMLMIPQDDSDGVVAFRRVWIMSAAMIVLSLFPAVMGMAGSVYVLAASLLGVGLLIAVHRAASLRTTVSAKELLHATVIYLPLLFLVMVLDKTAQLYV